jgi:homogentisate 1,2-dioxygenase
MATNTSEKAAALIYQAGMGNDFATEAMDGVLAVSLNSPQKPAFGLYSELISGTTFTAPRHLNRSTYVFRIHPSVSSSDFEPLPGGNLKTPPLEVPPYPGALRWSPLTLPTTPCDFIDGLVTLCGNGSPKMQTGMAVHLYGANKSMENRVFSNADGELLILPQDGSLRVVTELGILNVKPGELLLLPRGIKFRVDLVDGAASGFVCENYGHPFVLPDLGLIGSHGLANAIDFCAPVAAFEQRSSPYQLVHKFAGNLWACHQLHSPFDVVAWRGNWAPCKYDMTRFVAMGSASADHPDPSIFCALTSPSSNVVGANVDLMILPPRWIVSENTFRPPGFHRSSVAEFLALICGSHESRASRFPPGSMTVHNNWTAHGPDVKTFEGARNTPLSPVKVSDSLVFMLETRFPLELTAAAMQSKDRQRDCAASWDGFRVRFPNND